ncbi:serine protease FAM111A-like [Dicentrarchus labrax]|uniref:Protein FAM111A n=1 Tax=Dicentrarchus labrax TaxID=13489 RepID=A0A8P4KHS9_DICLA|nr:serine protease FAM111A-like [Dicentrarchus labrax]
MPPKKQKTKDIRSFFNKTDSPGSSSSTNTGSAQPGEAKGSQTATPTKVKKEDNCDAPGGHLHRFKVKFSCTDRYKYAIDCDRPRTVLEAIQSSEHYSKKMKKCSDENIVIQLGKSDKESIVATHFPCSCVSDGEPLIISCESEKVEEAQGQHCQPIHSRDKYSVFYIDTVGGLFTKQKKLFRNSAVKQFKYLCVYGEKGTTVEEALRRDGRFIDDLGDFTLSDNDNPNCIIGRKQKVDKLDKKEFKIRLPRNKRANDEEKQENSGASSNLQQTCGAKAVLDVIKQRGISVRTEVEKRGSVDDTGEIYDILRQQFPGLKELMESRFPDDSYQEALSLRKENFGKIQKSFSEVHRVRKLLKMGESVCKVNVGDVCEGTGFVLFDNFILTNAHLFKDCVEGERLKEGINVCVLFNYEDPEPHTNFYYFQLARFYLCSREDELDYAILELNPESQKPNETTQTKKMKVPPGLLKKFGPVPENGEACIIGHPAGEVKQMDPTCIIEKERRRQAVIDHLHQYKDNVFIVHNISQIIKDQGIDNIMMGGHKADKVVTYNTFMYHGSSGSPVFDVNGRVFGLHTAGFCHGFYKGSVIEFAQPLLTIFEHFVSKLKERNLKELLKRVKKEAKGNLYLEKVVRLKSSGTGECSDSDESMETD